MTGMCGWCDRYIWEADPNEFAVLVPNVPSNMPIDEQPVGGLSFCSEEHLDIFVEKNPHRAQNMKKKTIKTGEK